MPVTVRIPAVIQDRAGGLSTVSTGTGPLREVLAELSGHYPTLVEFIAPMGEVSPFVNLYVDGENVRAVAGLETPCPEGSQVAIVPAVSGG